MRLKCGTRSGLGMQVPCCHTCDWFHCNCSRQDSKYNACRNEQPTLCARCEERVICDNSNSRVCIKQTTHNDKTTFADSCARAAKVTSVTYCERPVHLWRGGCNLSVDVLELHGHTSNVDLVGHSPQDLQARTALLTVPLILLPRNMCLLLQCKWATWRRLNRQWKSRDCRSSARTSSLPSLDTLAIRPVSTVCSTRGSSSERKEERRFDPCSDCRSGSWPGEACGCCGSGLPGGAASCVKGLRGLLRGLTDCTSISCRDPTEGERHNTEQCNRDSAVPASGLSVYCMQERTSAVQRSAVSGALQHPEQPLFLRGLLQPAFRW